MNDHTDPSASPETAHERLGESRQDHQPAAAKLRLNRDHALHLLREMLRIRRFEERCAELYTEEKIRGFLHLYIGEEAIAVGARAIWLQAGIVHNGAAQTAAAAGLKVVQNLCIFQAHRRFFGK